MITNFAVVLFIFSFFLINVNSSLNLDIQSQNLGAIVATNISINDGDRSYYFKEYKIESEKINKINLYILNKSNNFGYVTFQVHSYAYNLMISANENFVKSKQIGTNLGLVLFESGIIFIKNPNKFNVSYAIAIISYNSSQPVVGGCNLEGEISESPILTIQPSNDNIIQVDTPSAALSVKEDPKQKLCSNEFNQRKLNYIGIYYYLPKGDFTKETYFNAIEKFLIVNNATKIGRMAFKRNLDGPANRRAYLQIPGTGMLFNTIVYESDSNTVAYVPAITYFCNPFVWEEGCNIIFDDNVLKFLTYALLITGILKTFISFGSTLIYFTIIINCFPVGAYYTYKVLRYLDISKEGLVSLVITGGVLSTLLITILCVILKQLKFPEIIVFVTSNILFSGIFTLNILYIFEGNSFTDNNGLYIFIFWFTLIFCGLMMCPINNLCSVCFRGIWLIINIIIGAYYMLLSFQIITKSNLIFIPLIHFYEMENSNYKYANGHPTPSVLDIWILFGAFGAILLGIILKRNNLCLIGHDRSEEEESSIR